MKTTLALVALLVFAPIGLAQPSLQTAPLRGGDAWTIVRHHVPGDDSTPIVTVVVEFVVGQLEMPSQDFHLRPSRGKIQATAFQALDGWTVSRGSKGSMNFRCASPAHAVPPGSIGRFLLEPTDPSARLDTGARWYITATGDSDTPPWKPDKVRQRGGTTTSPTPADPPGGTTPRPPGYEGGVIDYGPRVGDQTIGLPVAVLGLDGCDPDDPDPCPVILDPGGTTGLGASTFGVSSPVGFWVIVGLRGTLMIEVADLSIYDPEPNPWLEIETPTDIEPDQPALFWATPTGLSPESRLEMMIVADDDGDGVCEPAWDLCSVIYPIEVR